MPDSTASGHGKPQSMRQQHADGPCEASCPAALGWVIPPGRLMGHEWTYRCRPDALARFATSKTPKRASERESESPRSALWLMLHFSAGRSCSTRVPSRSRISWCVWSRSHRPHSQSGRTISGPSRPKSEYRPRRSTPPAGACALLILPGFRLRRARQSSAASSGCSMELSMV